MAAELLRNLSDCDVFVRRFPWRHQVSRSRNDKFRVAGPSSIAAQEFPVSHSELLAREIVFSQIMVVVPDEIVRVAHQARIVDVRLRITRR